MTFNDRERFIFHICTALIMSVKDGATFDGKAVEDLIRKNRARKLTEKDILEIRDEIQEEVLLSGYVYEEILKQLEDGRHKFGSSGRKRHDWR